MTRLTIENLVNLVDTDLLDNNTGDITPAILRAVLSSMVESMSPTIAMAAGSSVPGVAIPLTTTPVKLPGSFFTTFVTGNASFMEGRPAPEGDIILHTDVGRLHTNFDVTFQVANGVDIAFTLAKNGVVLPFRSVVTGRGAGNQVSTSFSWLFESIVPGDTVDIWASALTGAPTITLFGAAIKGILLPQFA